MKRIKKTLKSSFFNYSLDEKKNSLSKFVDILNNLGKINIIVVGKRPKILNSNINFLTEKLSHSVVKK
jgi:hypothetical protein